MSCAALDCLRSIFAPSFKAAHVISFIKPPYIEKLEKDVPLSFPHGTYLTDCKMVERHKP